ncbi:MAG: hypothetical protein R2716_05770 [Microthrixaceae bacterium]
MSTGFYIAAAWVGTLGTTAAYAAWLVRRGKQLSQEVPEEQRRWM